jgi:hypothetical protein
MFISQVFHARDQNDFIKKWLHATGFVRIQDHYLWKFGMVIMCYNIWVSLDAGGRVRDSVPAVELMTVAYKDGLGREFVPNPHPYVNLTILPSISGKPHLMRNQNIIMCRSLRRGGFLYKGKLLNPHEKPMQAMAWAIERFTKPGTF